MKHPLLQRSIRCIGGAARAAARSLGHADRMTSASSVAALKTRLPAGILRVRPSCGDSVHARVTLYSSRWPRGNLRPAAPRLEFGQRGERGSLILEVELPPGDPTGLWLDLRVAMPEFLGLTAEVRAGTILVADLCGHLDLEVAAGSIRMTGSRAAYRAVDLRSDLGAVCLRVAGRRIPGDGLVSESLIWKEGSGSSQVRAKCRVGEISATLGNGVGAARRELAFTASNGS